LLEETEELYAIAQTARRAKSRESQRLLDLLHRRLSEAGARKADHPQLNVLLARVEYKLYELNHDDRLLRLAAAGFARVASRAHGTMARASALNELAVCQARLGAAAAEVTSYDAALRHEPHAESRAILLANRAEGHMTRGDIRRAIRGYRISLRDTPTTARHRLSVTTLWGLAVALDRDGDLEAAFEQIRLARSYDPKDAQLQGPHWFFVPAHDVHWYAALGYWARARQSKMTADRKKHYRHALKAWDRYIARADRTDRWRGMATERRGRCQTEQQEATRSPKSDR
jgi:tetratricopeptide (TPR) repeat protein